MTPAENDESNNHARNLTIALGFLESYWDQLSKNLTPEQQSLLVAELEKLEPRIQNSKDLNETSEEAIRFFSVFSQIEPLAFLSDLEGPQKRGGSLPSPEDEVKIKILNYCVMLKKKMQEELPD